MLTPTTHYFQCRTLGSNETSHISAWQVLLVTFPRFFFKGLLEDTKRTGFLARLCCGGGAKPRVSQQPPSGVSVPGSPTVSARASPSVSASRHSRFKDPRLFQHDIFKPFQFAKSPTVSVARPQAELDTPLRDASADSLRSPQRLVAPPTTSAVELLENETERRFYRLATCILSCE